MVNDLQVVATAQRAAKQLGLPFVRLTSTVPTAEALALVPEALAREYRVMPVAVDIAAHSVTVAVGDPSLLVQPAPSFLQELKQQRGLRLILQLTPASDLDAALAAYTRLSEEKSVKSEASKTPAASVVKPAQLVAPPSSTPPASNDSSPLTPHSSPDRVPASVHSAQVPTVDLSAKSIPRETLERFPQDVARKFGMVVFALSAGGKEASVAVTNPADTRVREILKFVQERNGVRIQLFRTDRKSLDAALAQYARPEAENAKVKSHHTKPSVEPNAEPTSPPASQKPNASPAPIPVRQASADIVRSAAKQPAQPSALPDRQAVVSSQPAARTSAPMRPPLTVAPKPVSVAPVAVVGAVAVPVPAIGEIRPAQSASDYQRQVTRNSSTPIANVPIIDAADLIAPATLAGAPAGGIPTPASSVVLPQMEEHNLDTILGGQITDVKGLENSVRSGLIPKVVAAVLAYAVSLGASDVHVEAGKEGVRVRYRIDGKLQEIMKLPLTLLAPFVSRIKILAKLKIDESRVPQDGRFDVEAAGRQIDLRVSTLPTVFGEKVVLRLLDKAAGLKKLDELGITGTNLTRVRSVIDDPFGIILVTGPTGSGKTTTLYAMLSEVNTPDVNIVTLEDPVEYQLDGINQTQVRSKIGFGFADGLRSILRQDPNIIMVGEIRDKETAALATQAALTGHLVLATLHTNDAAGAIPRMLDMGVEPFLLASSVRAVIAQRLVRQLIPETRVEASVLAEALEEVKASLAAGRATEVKEAAAKPLAFFGAKSDASGGGYKGRVGIYEVLTVSESIAQLTLQKAAAAKIAATALEEGMVTLRQDGILKALAGQTSLDEVLQATAE